MTPSAVSESPPRAEAEERHKVAVSYVPVAFVGLQIVDLPIPTTPLLSWAGAFLLAIVIVGFPVAVVIA